MLALTNESKTKLRMFFFNELASNEFESWIYTTDSLEAELGDYFLELVGLDYSDSKTFHTCRKLIAEIYMENTGNAHSLYDEQARYLAERALKSEISLEEGCLKLAKLEERSSIVGAVFSAYADELIRLKPTNHYDERIRSDMKALLKS